MCDDCNAGIRHGVAALEALANGEEVPETPEGVAVMDAQVHRPNFELPFPVIAFETDRGNVGILTNAEGWAFMKKVLELLGHADDD